MSILPTVNVENIFTSDELDVVSQHVQRVGNLVVDTSSAYDDSGRGGRSLGNVIAHNIYWDYHDCPEIEKVLGPTLEKLLQRKLIVTRAHILEAKIPYLIHTDFIHENQGRTPEYTVIIPLETYDSMTVCFNEWADGYNDFELFKQNYSEEVKLKMDPKFCARRLSHLHPKDLMYLTLHDTFTWTKGSVFAMDRRYFHCSDNFPRHGLDQKRAIVLWTFSNN